jgi:predicted transcriptional regulator
MTDIDGELLDRLTKLFLDHRGKENAISSGQIADKLGIDDGTGNTRTRKAITELLDEREVPVVAGPNGYYLPESLDEARVYDERLTGRMAGIQQRRTNFHDACEEYFGQRPNGGEA